MIWEVDSFERLKGSAWAGSNKVRELEMDVWMSCVFLLHIAQISVCEWLKVLNLSVKLLEAAVMYKSHMLCI